MSSKILVCTQCGYVGEPKTSIKGNGFIELILWLFFIIPGVIYSIWRSSSRHKTCPLCKSTNLIPTDSPRAKSIMSESPVDMQKPKIDNKDFHEDEKTNADTNTKKTGFTAWCNKNPIKLIFIVLLGFPFMVGFLSGFIGMLTSQNQSSSTQIVPEVSLNERLKKINNDPYWADKTPKDYSSNIKIQAQSMVFSTYSNDVLEGEKSASPEDKKLASEIKTKLIAKQVAEYPKMRKAYAELSDKTVWEQNIDVYSSGVGNTTITLVGAVFASNKGISTVQASIRSMLKELRFKRVNYKWIEHDTDYQYLDLDSVTDKELKPISL